MLTFKLSTIVEIIRAYQPSANKPFVISYLQQQKLLELTSLEKSLSGRKPIYNSRNYQSLLAAKAESLSPSKSTIVEIIRAYQPFVPSLYPCFKSTIVEIIRAYQPSDRRTGWWCYLQQQKLLELTSLEILCFVQWLNLQQQKLLELTSHFPSYIIEMNLQQQKLLELTSRIHTNPLMIMIYNSRNYQSLLACKIFVRRI